MLEQVIIWVFCFFLFAFLSRVWERQEVRYRPMKDQTTVIVALSSVQFKQDRHWLTAMSRTCLRPRYSSREPFCTNIRVTQRVKNGEVWMCIMWSTAQPINFKLTCFRRILTLQPILTVLSNYTLYNHKWKHILFYKNKRNPTNTGWRGPGVFLRWRRFLTEKNLIGPLGSRRSGIW